MGGDEVVVCRDAGGRVIGTAVFAWEDGCGCGCGGGGGGGKRGRRRSNTHTPPQRCRIRAWTVQAKHRNQGLGTSLLREVVRLVRERGGAAVDFAGGEAGCANAREFFSFLPFFGFQLGVLVVQRQADVDMNMGKSCRLTNCAPALLQRRLLPARSQGACGATSCDGACAETLTEGSLAHHILLGRGGNGIQVGVSVFTL